MPEVKNIAAELETLIAALGFTTLSAVDMDRGALNEHHDFIFAAPLSSR
jgi:hypothetical protein